MPSAPASKAPRRLPARALVLAVSALVLSAALLAVGLVGFARSIGFVTHIGAASEALSEAGQIAPDRQVLSGGSSVTAGANPPRPAASASTAPTSPSRAAAPSAPVQARPSEVGGNAAASAPESSADGGNPGDEEPRSGNGGGGAETAAGGAPPNPWDNVVQNVLTLLGDGNSAMCGPNTCNVGQVCCNSSCGTCVAKGETCDEAPCAGAARAPTAVRCGAGQCNDGQVCCNPSCGICAAPSESCSSERCQ
jgi:hypothetical protein